MSVIPTYYEGTHPSHAGIFRLLKGTEENFESAVSYTATGRDLFVCGYAKCGNTWLQNILWRILHNGDPIPGHLRDHIAFLEFDGQEGVTKADRGDRYNIIKTHFPYEWVPKHPHAKYIYIARNPKDVCVSMYHHMKGFRAYHWEDVLFEDLYKLFLDGMVEGADYFRMLSEWYNVKDQPSILFLLYEDLKKNTRRTILDIAGFLDKEYVDILLNDDEIVLNRIMNETTVKEMRKEEKKWVKSERTSPFIRKGIIGDWRNWMTIQQARLLDERLLKVSAGSGFEKLWENFPDAKTPEEFVENK